MAAAAGHSLTRSDIEAWSTEHLDTAAAHWSTTAQDWEDHFTTIHNGTLRPGGSTWEGAGADAAAERSWGDLVKVRGAADALHAALGHATNGSGDIAWAKQRVLNAIAEAEEDGFTVGSDFSVTVKPSLLRSPEGRQAKATEHAHDIEAAVRGLVAADKEVGDRIGGALAPLGQLNFPDDGGKHDPTVRVVDNRVEKPGDGTGQPADGKDGHPDGKPAGAADPNGLAALLLPPQKPDGATAPKPGDKPPANAMDLIAAEQAKRDATAAAKPGTAPLTPLDALAGKDGKPAADPRYTKNPLLAPIVAADPSVLDQQRAKVDAAQRAVDAAQAKVDASVNQAITSGPYNGHDLNDSNPLARELFDARHNLIEQRNLLQDMNAAAAETGGHQVPVPALPEHADRQAFAPGPSLAERAPQEFADSNRAVHELTGGLVPDLFQDHHTATHWSEATPAERAQLIADAAGLVPLPGMKLGAEGLEHLAGPAADAFLHEAPPVVTHGLTHDAAPVAPHAPVDVPVAPHGSIGYGGDAAPPPVEHHSPLEDMLLGGHHEPTPPDAVTSHHLPEPDVFDPNQGLHYTSGDPHYPGGWPPGTPEQTYVKGETDHGWQYVNRGPDKDWMPYQGQITGVERLPDGRIPEYVMTNPETGAEVRLDSGPVMRGDQEFFLDAKHNYAPLFEHPEAPWTAGIREGLVAEAERQLRVLPDGAILEWHVANPQSAAIMRDLLESRGLLDVHVIYTPEKP